MRLASRLASWFRNLLRRARVERELDDELRSYRDLLVAEKVRMGMGFSFRGFNPIPTLALPLKGRGMLGVAEDCR